MHDSTLKLALLGLRRPLRDQYSYHSYFMNNPNLQQDHILQLFLRVKIFQNTLKQQNEASLVLLIKDDTLGYQGYDNLSKTCM